MLWLHVLSMYFGLRISTFMAESVFFFFPILRYLLGQKQEEKNIPKMLIVFISSKHTCEENVI